jgi:hypothetical protein
MTLLNLFRKPAVDSRTMALIRDLDEASDRLNALRSNCYLTDKDGVRRRYSAVSAEVRERAEAN